MLPWEDTSQLKMLQIKYQQALLIKMPSQNLKNREKLKHYLTKKLKMMLLLQGVIPALKQTELGIFKKEDKGNYTERLVRCSRKEKI